MSQVPEFEEAAFSAPLNKVVRCKTKFGWHLLQVLSERYFYKTHVLVNVGNNEQASRFIEYWSLFTPCLVREESLLKDIQPEELHARIQDPSFIDEAQLIDVREPDEVYALTFLFCS